MKVKICGVTTAADARLCADEGADYVGLIFAPSSPRRVGVAQARRVVRALPRGVSAVAVFMDQPLEEVREIARATGASMAQLHGREPEAYARAVGVPVLKVFDRFGKRDLERLRRYEVFAFLIDRPKANGSSASAALLRFADNAKTFGRVFLSGGLDASNVSERVRRVRPYGIDACSSTEARPGKKDPRRLRAFVEAARA